MVQPEIIHKVGDSDTRGYNPEKVLMRFINVDSAIADMTAEITLEERQVLDGLQGLKGLDDCRKSGMLGIDRSDRSSGMALSIRGPSLLQAHDGVSQSYPSYNYIAFPDGMLIGRPRPDLICDIREWAEGKKHHSFGLGYEDNIQLNSHKKKWHEAGYNSHFVGADSITATEGDVLEMSRSLRIFIPRTTSIERCYFSGASLNPVCGEALESSAVKLINTISSDNLWRDILKFLEKHPENRGANDSSRAILRSTSIQNLYFSIRTEPCLSVAFIDITDNSLKIHNFDNARDFVKFWLNIDNMAKEHAYSAMTL